jgi:hypothetical protein
MKISNFVPQPALLPVHRADGQNEVIMPKNVQTWPELMDVVVNKSLQVANYTSASYNFRNVYFGDDSSHSHRWEPNLPRHLHVLQHVYRSANYTKPNQYVKCFHNVERMLTTTHPDAAQPLPAGRVCVVLIVTRGLPPAETIK